MNKLNNEVKFKLVVYGLLGVCFYLLFDWSATHLEILDQTSVKMDDNLALRGFYVFVSMLGFILLIRCMYLFIGELFVAKKNLKIDVVQTIESEKNKTLTTEKGSE